MSNSCQINGIWWIAWSRRSSGRMLYLKIPIIRPLLISPPSYRPIYLETKKIHLGYVSPSEYKPPLCRMTVLNRAKCCFIMTFQLKNVFWSTLLWLVSKRFFYFSFKSAPRPSPPAPPPPHPPPPEYKPLGLKAHSKPKAYNRNFYGISFSYKLY